MSFRVLFIESNATLKCKLDNLIVNTKDKESWIPLDDISMIVLDNLKTSITSRLLCNIAKQNISLIICDQQHLPIGFYSSYNNHSRSSKIIGKQISIEEELKYAFWKDVIIAKLTNQRKVLEKIMDDNEIVDKINGFILEVLPGDISNREAHGAKIYFNKLMGKSFSRGDNNILLNSGLNYGYTIVRSYISRLCVGYGLNTQIGFHHHNEYNRFNLVDDLIEPVRPIVDLHAYQLLRNCEYFTSKHRESLVNILNHKIRFMGQNQYLSNMLEKYVISVVSGINDNCFEKVKFPDVNNYLGEDI